DRDRAQRRAVRRGRGDLHHPRTGRERVRRRRGRIRADPVRREREGREHPRLHGAPRDRWRARGRGEPRGRGVRAHREALKEGGSMHRLLYVCLDGLGDDPVPELGDRTPLEANVTNTHPAYRKEGSLGVALERFENRVATGEPLDDSEEARRAAGLTNAFVEGAARVLEASEVNRRRVSEGRLPGNLVLTRD